VGLVGFRATHGTYRRNMPHRELVDSGAASRSGFGNCGKALATVCSSEGGGATNSRHEKRVRTQRAYRSLFGWRTDGRRRSISCHFVAGMGKPSSTSRIGSGRLVAVAFFAGLFVVVEGFVKADRDLLDMWINDFGAEVSLTSVVKMSGATIIGSNLFSNVPFVLIVGHWVRRMSNPKLVWLLLALTSTFAGNLTLFGSVANVIVAQGTQKREPLRFTDFLWTGLPITLSTTAVGVFLLWAFFASGWI